MLRRTAAAALLVPALAALGALAACDRTKSPAPPPGVPKPSTVAGVDRSVVRASPTRLAAMPAGRRSL